MKNTLYFVPHDLVLDPRVKWLAESISKFSEVLVLGIKEETEKVASFPPEIKTLQSSPRSLNLFKSLRTIASVLDIKNLTLLFFALLVSVLLLPLLILALSTKRFLTKYFSTRDLISKFFILKLLRDINLLKQCAVKFLTISSTFDDLKEQIPSKKYDFIVANDLDSLLAAVHFKKKNGGILVYDSHEFYPYQFPQVTFLVGSVLSWWENNLLKTASSVLCVTPQIGAAMKKKYSLKNVYVIPNCSPASLISATLSEPHEKISFLYQGIFAEGRGIEALVQNWLRLSPPNARLILRGPESETKQKCRALAEKAGDELQFVDPVTEDELIASAQQADVGVIPYEATSLNNLYCCPNKLSQYMHAGVAILANDLPFVKATLIRSESGVVFTAGNFESFSEAVNQLISDSEQLRKMKRNSLKFAQEFFNWECASSQVLPEIFGEKP